MTVSADSESNANDNRPAGRVLRRSGFTIAADGSYAACLAEAEPLAGGAEGAADDGPPDPGAAGGGLWFPERWTLDGPEPYAVPLPGTQPEEPGTQVLPLSDGRVLIMRRVADRHDLALLYPAGPGTGELPVCSLPGTEVRLLPPPPGSGTAYALVRDDSPADAEGRTAIWRVHDTAADGTPARVTTVRGRCTGGVWLDRTGRLLALDRELGGRTKAVAADLHTGEVSPLLQLTEDSDDRLLVAEPDSGLLLLRSDATGEARLGWGVLGSRHPVRFPDALVVPGALLTPVAAQPGQILSPESCVVALRAEVPGGAESLALWRPGERRLHWRASPAGWLRGAAVWLPGAELCLPYAAPDWPCGLLAYGMPAAEAEAEVDAESESGPAIAHPAEAAPVQESGTAARFVAGAPAAVRGGPPSPPLSRGGGNSGGTRRRGLGFGPAAAGGAPLGRPLSVLPLQQAPLAAAQAG